MSYTKEYIKSLKPDQRRKLFWDFLDNIPAPEFRGTTRNSKGQLVIQFFGYKPQVAYTLEEVVLLPFGIRYVAMEYDKHSGWTHCYAAFPNFE